MTTEANEVVDQSVQTEDAPLEGEKHEVQNTPDETAESGDVESKQEEPAKKFSQEEVDAMVQKRLAKERLRVQKQIEKQMHEQVQAERLRNEPKRESFVDDDEFMRAQVEHLAEVKAAQKLAERKAAEEAERRNESFQEKAEAAIERYPDFHSVVNDPSLRINEAMAEFITESEIGPDVAYYLGKNPAKAAQISQLSPVRAAVELTKIQAELAARPKAQVSKAPEPITPIGQRGKSSSSSLPSDDDDIETWMRKEAARTRSR